MMQYYILAVLHHLTVFALFGIVVAELAMTQPGISAATIRRIGKFDTVYGTLAGAILVIGFVRVFFGGKGAAYYFSNPFFHAKLTFFIIAGLLSIVPTMRFIQWRRALGKDERHLPSPAAIKSVRRWLHAEIAVLALVPVAAVGLGLGLGV
jgi:putative membrane protein